MREIFKIGNKIVQNALYVVKSKRKRYTMGSHTTKSKILRKQDCIDAC